MKIYETPVLMISSVEISDILTLSVGNWQDPSVEQEFGAIE